MIVVTAGHVDHGKTALIRAITGIETDRLPEERRRGLSIDLGFASWAIGDGNRVSFIDTPGHERFVRNMLAGVGGADFALLVVAADDGVMPQTKEHADILELLGVRRGIVVINKCDRVPRDRVDEVRQQLGTLLAPTGLAQAEMFETSAITGHGIAEIGQAIMRAAAQRGPRQFEDRHFRLAIDRSFSIPGAGTIVTGTIGAGRVADGARLVLSPEGLEVRVRGLQVAGKAVGEARAGDRCAINLAAIEATKAGRGDWLVAREMHAPTLRLTVRLKNLATGSLALRHNAPVHFHIGTASIPARLLIPGQEPIGQGDEAVVQVLLEHPGCALTGDRFIIRDGSAQRTIGGGRVVDPSFTDRRRKVAIHAAVAEAMQSFDPERALAALLDIQGYEVDTGWFERSFNLKSETASELYKGANAVLLGKGRKLALPAARVDRIGDEIVEAVARHHRAYPESEGMRHHALKRDLSTDLSAEVFDHLHKQLHEKSRIASTGGMTKLPEHVPTFSEVDRLAWSRLRPWLEARGARPITTDDVAREMGMNHAYTADLLHRRCSSGDLWQVVAGRFLLSDQVASLAETADEVARRAGPIGFTAAQYRDALGTGRALAIHILEFFDRIGVTRRNGDLRWIDTRYQAIVGKGDSTAPSI